MQAHNDSDHVGWGEILARNHRSALILVCMGVSLHAADSLLVATMLPSIISEIGGEALVGWTVALYEIGSILMGAASGVLALRYGLKAPMGCAAALFALGCIVSAVAHSMWIVLLGRLMQGFGGGGLAAMSFVAVARLFPPRLVPRAMAIVSTLWGMSAFFGPLIGGFFVEYATWRIGFAAFAAQALIMATWIAFFIEIPKRTRCDMRDNSVALGRLSLLAVGVVSVAYAGIDVAAQRTSAFVILGLVCLIAFVALDRRATDNRFLPADAGNISTATGASLLMVLSLSTATIAITAYGPLFVVMLHGASALVGGYIVACASIGWTLAAVSVSGFDERFDRRFIALGMTIVVMSIFGFIYSVPNGPLWLIAICAGLEGAGFGMAWVFILRQTIAAAPDSETERISAALPTMQRLGFALGAAGVGIVANAYGFNKDMGIEEGKAASQAIFVACLPFAAVGLFAMTRFIRATRLPN